MKTRFLFPIVLVIAFAAVSSMCGGCADGWCVLSGVHAQVSRGPVTPKRDPQLEKEGDHQLDVAWQYFKRRVHKSDKEALARIDKAIIDRLNQVYAENPLYSKIDEVLYLLGLVYHRDDNLDEAQKNFKLVIEKYPESKWVKDSEKQLAVVQGAAKKPASTKDSKSDKSDK